MRVVCPKCQENDCLVGCDIVSVNAEIDDWIIGDDELPVPMWSGASEIIYDTQEPVNPDKPYWCHNCDLDLSAEDLLILYDDEHEEIQ
jgi:hypothetical protein